MKLVRLTPQRRSGRWNLYFDNGTTLGISSVLLADFHLKVGQELTTRQFQKLTIAAWEEKSYQKSLRLLALRPRSLEEINGRLQRYLYRFLSPEKRGKIIARVIHKLKQENLLDDRAFAAWWVEQHQKRGWSRRQLWQELARKGIAKNIIQEILESYSESESLRLLLQKRWRRWQKLSPREKRQKAWLLGQSRGFSGETIKTIIDEFWQNR